MSINKSVIEKLESNGVDFDKYIEMIADLKASIMTQFYDDLKNNKIKISNAETHAESTEAKINALTILENHSRSLNMVNLIIDNLEDTYNSKGSYSLWDSNGRADVDVLNNLAEQIITNDDDDNFYSNNSSSGGWKGY